MKEVVTQREVVMVLVDGENVDDVAFVVEVEEKDEKE